MTNWFKDFGHLYHSAEIQLLKNFIDGKIQPGPAAISLTKSVDMKDEFHSPLYQHSTAIILLAVYSLDSAIQRKFVKLASAIRTIRKRSLNLDNKTLPSNILDEMDEIIGDWWESFWCDSQNLNCVNEHLFWVSLNEFTAWLTKANICDWVLKAATLCNSLLEDHKLGENPEDFNVVLSCIAQTIRKDPTLFALACQPLLNI